MKKMVRRLNLLVGALAGLAVAAVCLTPYAYAEYFMWARAHHLSAAPAPADPAAFDPRPGPIVGAEQDGWRVQQIAPDTYALGEPADDLDNYEYLLVGQTRALLIDAGSTARDIKPVLASLTKLPVTVIPTHLHFDHTHGLQNLDKIALIDLPKTRRRAEGDLYRLRRYQYMKAPDGTGPFDFHVSEWVKPDSEIDLGGRKVKVLSTPRHTATSVSIYDPAAKLLFTGDLIRRTRSMRA